MNAEAAVAEWCAASGREDAAVTILEGQNTAQVLRDFWYVARVIGESGAAGQRVVAFPNWAEAANDPSRFQAVLNHIDICSEGCEYVGESLMCIGRHPAAQTGEPAAPYPLMLLRSISPAAPDLSDLGDDVPWFYLDDDDADPVKELGLEGAPPPPPPVSDEDVLVATHEWVDAVIVHMKVCPFSATTFQAGVPIGGVTYPISRASTPEELYQAFWQEVENLALVDERQLATVLLVAPQFALQSAPGFDAFADTLNNALTEESGLGYEESLQLVFFHPEFTFRDGQNRFGTENEGAAANYARRSPYPMINLLRTPQVRAAQKGVPTGSVYTTNEGNLATIGAAELQAMLERREWGGIYDGKFTKHNVDVIRGV